MSYLRRHLLTILALALICSLAVQTYVGERGLQARSALETQIAGLNKKLDLLRGKRRALEQRTKLLTPGSIDTETIEYQARDLLGFVREKERLYLKKEQ